MNRRATMTATAAAAVSVCLGACGGEASPRAEEVSAAVADESVDNGIHVNGIHVNGLRVNGIHIDGLHPSGTTLNGNPVVGMTLQGTVFSGTVLGAPASGLAFIGARMTATLPDSSVIQLRVDDISPSADPEILLYDVSYSTDGLAFAPLCLDHDGAPVRALPLAGLWDESEGTATGGAHLSAPGELTFACESYALAKCVEIGYKPWDTTTECKSPGDCHTVSLAYLHQACTRMIRADYCGDGMSLTREGTLIDVWDAFGLETPSMPAWRFEAEWSVGGASCVRTTRWPTTLGSGDDKGIKIKKYIEQHCPDRWVGEHQGPCGDLSSTFYTSHGYATPLDTRSLLMTRTSTP